MLALTWLGHSTFLLRLDNGETILTDPWIENPRYPEGFELPRIDTILLTHGHFDHIASVLPLHQRFGARIVTVVEVGVWLESKGATNVIAMNKGGTAEAGSIRATLVQAQHTSSIQDGDQTIYGGEPCGFILHLAGGRTLYFAGDTAVFSDMALFRELYAPDLAFLPIGGFYTMDPKQAALAVKLLGVATVVPMHYGTFPALAGTPEELQALTGAAVLRLTPGTPVEI
jgi:L-ascorbate metabolism protein UlaG (beta-lactamase superfamily)